MKFGRKKDTQSLDNEEVSSLNQKGNYFVADVFSDVVMFWWMLSFCGGCCHLWHRYSLKLGVFLESASWLFRFGLKEGVWTKTIFYRKLA